MRLISALALLRATVAWDYLHPELWGEAYPVCGNGNASERQSPIDVILPVRARFFLLSASRAGALFVYTPVRARTCSGLGCSEDGDPEIDISLEDILERIEGGVVEGV